jgi:hypothetical protein
LSNIYNFYDAFFNITKNNDLLQPSHKFNDPFDQNKKPDPDRKGNNPKPSSSDESKDSSFQAKNPNDKYLKFTSAQMRNKQPLSHQKNDNSQKESAQ